MDEEGRSLWVVCTSFDHSTRTGQAHWLSHLLPYADKHTHRKIFFSLRQCSILFAFCVCCVCEHTLCAWLVCADRRSWECVKGSLWLRLGLFCIEDPPAASSSPVMADFPCSLCLFLKKNLILAYSSVCFIDSLFKCDLWWDFFFYHPPFLYLYPFSQCLLLVAEWVLLTFFFPACLWPWLLIYSLSTFYVALWKCRPPSVHQHIAITAQPISRIKSLNSSCLCSSRELCRRVFLWGKKTRNPSFWRSVVFKRLCRQTASRQTPLAPFSILLSAGENPGWNIRMHPCVCTRVLLCAFVSVWACMFTREREPELEKRLKRESKIFWNRFPASPAVRPNSF